MIDLIIPVSGPPTPAPFTSMAFNFGDELIIPATPPAAPPPTDWLWFTLIDRQPVTIIDHL